MLIASSQGGMDIEAVAKENPNAIIKEHIEIVKGALVVTVTVYGVPMNI